MIINGKNKILGRLSSHVARYLLKNKDIVTIVNAKDIIISGNKLDIFDTYKRRTEKKAKANPSKHPIVPKYPDAMVKRTIRGMLPRSSAGTSALRRLKVYIDVPEEYVKDLEKPEKLQNIEHVKLYELCKFLGGKLK